MKPKAKLEKIIQELQENAESENAHSMYSIYEGIAASVEKHGGVEVAVKVMQDILDSNGYID